MAFEAFADSLCEKITNGRSLNSHGFEPVYYVVYDPKRTREAMNFRKILKPRLEDAGYTVFEFNVFRELWSILESNQDEWSELEAYAEENPLEWDELQETLSEIARGSGGQSESLADRLKKKLRGTEGSEKPVMLVTGVHALHGFMRPGDLENLLNGEFVCPTVFFYPGKKEGRDALKFLNFCKTDANYRSEHLELP